MNSKGDLIVYNYRGQTEAIWYRRHRGEEYRPLDETILERNIPCYKELAEKSRIKRIIDFLNQCDVQKKVNVRILDTVKTPYSDIHTLKIGAQLLMQSAELFEDYSAGYRTVALTLASMRCECLRKELVDFLPVLFIKNANKDEIDIFRSWIYAMQPRTKWKKKKVIIHRKPVLDYQAAIKVDHKLLDFNRATIRKKKRKFQTPVSYDDVLIAVIGVSVQQLHELQKVNQYAGMLLINSAKGGYEGSWIQQKQISRVDIKLHQKICANSWQIASVLDIWRRDEEDEAAWAKQIANAAKASFGKPDSRYRSVSFDPVRLQDAVYLEVCRSFADFVVSKGWIDASDVEKWIMQAEKVFTVKQHEPEKVLRMENPETFLEILNNWYRGSKEKLVGQEEPFHKNEGHEGAIRLIAGKEYLVLPEEWLKKVYIKEARRFKCDCSFSERADWMQKIQRGLCEAGILKYSSRNYRYRYDLHQNGKRDETYVLAIPLEMLK